MPPGGTEIELKFGVAPERVAALRRALEAGAVRTERLRAIYYDTDDEQLARAGAAVRLRREGRRWVQTLKVATADALQRFEHDAAVPSPPNRAEPVLVLARHAGTPAALALGASVQADALALRERFRTDVRRTLREVRVAGARLELALDVGAVVAGRRVEPLREFEIELKGGRVEGLLAGAVRWLDGHGLWISTLTKAGRGARLARGEAAAAVHAAPLEVEAGCDAAAFWRAALRAALDHAIANLASLAEGSVDDAIVHQARVGLRRLRTVLRTLTPTLPDAIDPAWESALQAGFAALGAHRDADVVLPVVRAELPLAGVPAFGDPAPPEAPRPLAEIARDPALQRALLGLLTLAASAQAAAWAPLAAVPAREDLAARLEALHARLERDARRFAALDAERQHRVRKRLKRLRYLSEFAAPLFGSKRVQRYLARWRDAQDALGATNDARVAADAWRRQAEAGDAGAWYAVGWLAARDAAQVEACRAALRRAAKARRFWDARD